MKIRPVGTELFHADRQRRDEADSSFRNSAKAPKTTRKIWWGLIHETFLCGLNIACDIIQTTSGN